MKHLTGKLIIKEFGNETDQTGETEGYWDFEFKLVKPIYISYGGRSYMYDRLKWVSSTWSNPIFFVGPKKARAEMPVPGSMIKEMFEIVRRSEADGNKLEGWCFSDDLEEMLSA